MLFQFIMHPFFQKRSTPTLKTNAGVDKAIAIMDRVFVYLQSNPHCLEIDQPEMRKRLDAMCGKGQGLGNKAVPHEACFAVVLEQFGFIPYEPTKDGSFYKYQVGGTQRSIDFQLLTVQNGKVISTVNIDLKHGSAESIFLNDGTFLEDVVYVISLSKKVKVDGTRKKQTQNICVVSLGQDIMTDKDRAALETWRGYIRQGNELAKTMETDHLVLYARSANRYECGWITSEFMASCLQKLQSFALRSAPQTEQEQHSQSV